MSEFTIISSVILLSNDSYVVIYAREYHWGTVQYFIATGLILPWNDPRWSVFDTLSKYIDSYY